MINVSEIKNTENVSNVIANEIKSVKEQKIAQNTLKKNINNRIQKINEAPNKTSFSNVLSDFENALSQIEKNLEDLHSLQNTLENFNVTIKLDSKNVKAYNQLYVDVDSNIADVTESVEKNIKDFDLATSPKAKVAAAKASRITKSATPPTPKTIKKITEATKRNITCFFPKSNTDIFAIATIHEQYTVYINSNNTVRVSIEDEDFDISIKTPNVQISNEDKVLLISRVDYGYTIKTNIDIDLPDHINITRISKDKNFLEFDVKATELTLFVNKDILSFLDANEDGTYVETTHPTNFISADPTSTLVAPSEKIKVENKNNEIISEIPAQNIVTTQKNVAKSIQIEPENVAQPPVTPVNKVVNPVNLQPVVGDTVIGLEDNNKLIISEENDKIILPYKIEELNETLEKNPKKYSSINEIISKEYTLSSEQFKNPAKSRFREAFRLIKKKEHGSLKEAIDLGMELMFQSDLNPAIITACRDLEQLDIYLNCLDENELDKFDCFEIIYKVPPTKGKKK